MAENVKYLDSDGATSITGIDFGTITAGKAAQLKKFGIQNISDRSLAAIQEAINKITGNDGGDFLTFALDTATLSMPWGLATALGAGGAGGVWGATGTYGYRLTATNALGETIGSAEVTVAVDDTTKKVTVSWVQTPNAAGYKLYRTATPGTYGASTLRATIGSGATVSFLDDGSATSSGTPAAANKTAGWALGLSLGSTAAGGIWVATGLNYWILVAFDSGGNVLAQTFEGSVNVDDTTKKVTLTWTGLSDAASYKLYRSTNTGVYSSPALRATLAAGTTSYLDDGTPAGAGALVPVASYGIPPLLSAFLAGPLSISNEAINEQWFLWLRAAPTPPTPSVGNPRLANIGTAETA